MQQWTAQCSCGSVEAVCLGEPVRISVCHCWECQRRSGGPFSAQARWPADRVEIKGAVSEWTRTESNGAACAYKFCPVCGSTIAFTNTSLPDLVAVPIGAFARTDLPRPTVSVYEARKHPWVEILGDEVEHLD